MDDDLWLRFAITEEILQAARKQREQAQDMSWFGTYIGAIIDDGVARPNLKPDYLRNPILGHIWALYHSMTQAQGFQCLQAGKIKALPDRFPDSILRKHKINVVAASRSAIGQECTATFSFHCREMLNSFRFYRAEIVEDGKHPVVRILLSRRELPQFQEIIASQPGEPILNEGSGFRCLNDVNYEFLFDGDVELNDCWEFKIDETDADESAARLLAFALTYTNPACVRLVCAELYYFGLNILFPFKFWLKRWGVPAEMAESVDDSAIASGLKCLADGDPAMAAEMLRDAGRDAVFGYVCARLVAEPFNYSERGVQLYLT